MSHQLLKQWNWARVPGGFAIAIGGVSVCACLGLWSVSAGASACELGLFRSTPVTSRSVYRDIGLAVDGAGTLHVSYSLDDENLGWSSTIFHATSRDGGRSWPDPHAVVDYSASTLRQRSRLAFRDDSDEVAIAWQELAYDVDDTRVLLREVSTWFVLMNGLGAYAERQPVSVAERDSSTGRLENASWLGDIVATSGTFVCCFSRAREGDVEVFVVRSDASGARWSTETRVTTFRVSDRNFPLRLVGAQGVLYMATVRDRRAWLHVSEDSGASWRSDDLSSLLCDEEDVGVLRVDISVGADGDLGLVWSVPGAHETVLARFARSSDGGKSWSPCIEISRPLSHAGYLIPRICGTTDDEWHVTALSYPGFGIYNDIQYVYSCDDGVSWSGGRQVNPAPHRVNGDSRIVAGLAGLAYIAWLNADEAYGSTPYLRSTDPSSGGFASGDGPLRVTRWPNPVPVLSPVHLSINLLESRDVTFAVYDLAGHALRRDHLGHMSAGSHRFTWNGRDERGWHMKAGVYFVELRAGRDLLWCDRVVYLR